MDFNKYYKNYKEVVIFTIITLSALLLTSLITTNMYDKKVKTFTEYGSFDNDSLINDTKIQILTRVYMQGYSAGSLNTIKYAGRNGSVKLYHKRRKQDSIDFKTELYERARK